MLKLTNITHCYGTAEVLQNRDLTLHPGRRLALMGPSGCGKTTLLRIALGMVKPTAGTVVNTFTKPAAVFQEPRLLPWRTALENVNLVLADNRDTENKARFHLELLGLADATGKYPQELSGGMQQRVAIARALAVEGDLLVLDEPFKALNQVLRQQVIGRVGETRAAILLVTHDPEEAAALDCEIIQL